MLVQQITRAGLTRPGAVSDRAVVFNRSRMTIAGSLIRFGAHSDGAAIEGFLRNQGVS